MTKRFCNQGAITEGPTHFDPETDPAVPASSRELEGATTLSFILEQKSGLIKFLVEEHGGYAGKRKEETLSSKNAQEEDVDAIDKSSLPALPRNLGPPASYMSSITFHHLLRQESGGLNRWVLEPIQAKLAQSDLESLVQLMPICKVEK